MGRMGMWVVVMVVMIGWWWSVPTSEAGSMTCTSSLAACLSPLQNATETPSPTCCIPLKEAVKNQKQCLCGLLNDPAALAINVTTGQIFSLTSRCEIADATPSMCSAGPSPTPTPMPPPPPGTKTGMANVAGWSGTSLVLAGLVSLVF